MPDPLRWRLVASDPDPTPVDAGPPPCSPCRGTGRVTSNLGGSASELACPWCEGTGRLIAEHDAQAARGAASEASPDDRPAS